MQEKVFYQARLTKMWAIMFGSLVPLVLVLPISLALSDDPAKQAKAWSAFMDFATDWQLLAAVAAMVVLAVVVSKFQSAATLRISEQGVDLDMPLKPAWLAKAFEVKPFSIRWDEIREIVLSMDPAGRAPLLTIVGDDGEAHTLRTMTWSDDRAADLSAFKILRLRIGASDETLKRLLDTDPVLRSIQQFRSAITVGEAPKPKGPGMSFDIAKNTPALMVSVIALTAGVLGLVDYLHYGPTYMTAPPWIVCILMGVAAGVVAKSVLERDEIPQLERHGIAVLAGLGIGILSISALLRLDSFMSDGYHEVIFELHSDRVLRAADPMVPELEAPLDRPFWHEQPAGSTWPILVAHGPLGIWQYDQGPLVAIIREHYARSQ